MANQILRWAIADYLNTGTVAEKTWSLMGLGFTQLDENPNPVVDEKAYINDKASTKSITGYGATFPFTADVYSDEAAIMKIEAIAESQATGSAAVVEYLRTKFLVDNAGNPITTTVDARKFNVAVEVSGITGAGTEALVIAGNLHQRGDMVPGTFNLSTKAFTEASLTALTVTSTASASVDGKTVIAVSGVTLDTGEKFAYKITDDAAASVVYGQMVDNTWTQVSDFSDEISSTDGKKIAVVALTAAGAVYAYGTATVDVK